MVPSIRLSKWADSHRDDHHIWSTSDLRRYRSDFEFVGDFLGRTKSFKRNIVTSVEVSDGYAHDCTADPGFQLEVSADKGYLGASNMLATLQRGAIPYIPFRTEQF